MHLRANPGGEIPATIKLSAGVHSLAHHAILRLLSVSMKHSVTERRKGQSDVHFPG